jgi:penicillin-binding protein 1A
MDDVPLRFEKKQGGYTPWPGNSPAVYSGLTDIQDAVAYSKNTIAVRVLEKLGKERSYAYLTEKLGLGTLVAEEKEADGRILTDLAAAPLALGQLSHGVTLRALTNAYGALADGGVYHPSRSYSLVLDGNGNVLLENKERGERVFQRETACIMTKLLQGVTSYGTAKSISLDRLIDTAGKTGTSGENQDKWFVGYTPYYTAGIWRRYEDGMTAIPSELASVHLEIWDEIMQRLHSRVMTGDSAVRRFDTPIRVVAREYCKDSGMLPCETCRLDARSNRICKGYFTADNMPKETCTCHVAVLYDKKGGGVACAHCPGEQVEEVGMLLLPQRNFPVQVYVTDAQYGYRPLEGETVTREKERPFFEHLIPPGQYIGITRSNDGRQFNAICPLHDSGKQKDSIGEKGRLEEIFDWWRRYFSSSGGKK